MLAPTREEVEKEIFSRDFKIIKEEEQPTVEKRKKQ